MAISIDLHDRVVLVTGGTRGIGRGITEAFLAAGATVVTCSRSEAEPVAGTTHHVCDVRDPDAVSALVDAVRAQRGRLDVLVNNAGGAPYAAVPGEGRSAETDEMLTIAPPVGWACITRLAAWASTSGASRLSPTTRSWNRGEASAASAYGAPPALLTSTSRRPC